MAVRPAQHGMGESCHPHCVQVLLGRDTFSRISAYLPLQDFAHTSVNRSMKDRILADGERLPAIGTEVARVQFKRRVEGFFVYAESQGVSTGQCWRIVHKLIAQTTWSRASETQDKIQARIWSCLHGLSEEQFALLFQAFRRSVKPEQKLVVEPVEVEQVLRLGDPLNPSSKTHYTRMFQSLAEKDRFHWVIALSKQMPEGRGVCENESSTHSEWALRSCQEGPERDSYCATFRSGPKSPNSCLCQKRSS
jgi:hypothetical protein